MFFSVAAIEVVIIGNCEAVFPQQGIYDHLLMSGFGRADEYFLMYAKITTGIKNAFTEYTNEKSSAMSEHITKSGCAKFTGGGGGKILAFVKKTRTKSDDARRGGHPPPALFQPAAAPPRGDALRAAVRDEKEADTRVGTSRRQDGKAHDGERQPLDQDVHVMGIPCRCKHVGYDGPQS